MLRYNVPKKEEKKEEPKTEAPKPKRVVKKNTSKED